MITELTPLGAAEEYVGDWIKTRQGGVGIIGTIFADQPGTLHIEQSSDGEHVDVDTSYDIVAGDGKGFRELMVAPYWRLRYVNGESAQGAFRICGRGQ
jgi:hypothetical protein